MKAVEIKKGSTLRLTERAFFIPNGRFHHAVLASHRQCGDRGGQFSDGYESVGLNVVLPCKVEQNLLQHLQENIAMKRIDRLFPHQPVDRYKWYRFQFQMRLFYGMLCGQRNTILMWVGDKILVVIATVIFNSPAVQSLILWFYTAFITALSTLTMLNY